MRRDFSRGSHEIRDKRKQQETSTGIGNCARKASGTQGMHEATHLKTIEGIYFGSSETSKDLLWGSL